MVKISSAWLLALMPVALAAAAAPAYDDVLALRDIDVVPADRILLRRIDIGSAPQRRGNCAGKSAAKGKGPSVQNICDSDSEYTGKTADVLDDLANKGQPIDHAEYSHVLHHAAKHEQKKQAQEKAKLQAQAQAQGQSQSHRGKGRKARRAVLVAEQDLLSFALERRSGEEDPKKLKLLQEKAKHDQHSKFYHDTVNIIAQKGGSATHEAQQHYGSMAKWHEQQAKTAENQLKVHEKSKMGMQVGGSKASGSKRPASPGDEGRSHRHGRRELGLASALAAETGADALARRNLEVGSMDPIFLRLARRSGEEDPKKLRLQEEKTKHSELAKGHSDMVEMIANHAPPHLTSQAQDAQLVHGRLAKWHEQQAKVAENQLKVHEKTKMGLPVGGPKVAGSKRPHSPGDERRSQDPHRRELGRRAPAGPNGQDAKTVKLQEEKAHHEQSAQKHSGNAQWLAYLHEHSPGGPSAAQAEAERLAAWHEQKAKAAENKLSMHEKTRMGQPAGSGKVTGVKRPRSV